jgi:hypothetical protein
MGMETKKLRLQTIAAVPGQRRGAAETLRLVTRGLMAFARRALLIDRQGVKPFQEDTKRWADLGSIRRIGPRL